MALVSQIWLDGVSFCFILLLFCFTTSPFPSPLWGTAAAEFSFLGLCAEGATVCNPGGLAPGGPSL